MKENGREKKKIENNYRNQIKEEGEIEKREEKIEKN